MSTKLQILNAAESLFAEHGFADTSLRQITNQANVNLAAVNYHFGSKKGLVQASVGRYMECLVPVVDGALDTLQQKTEQASIEEVLQAIVPAFLTLETVRHDGTAIFMRLLGRGYAETQGHLRKFVQDNYGASLSRLMAMIKTALPQLSEEQVFWRIHFALGTFVFTMASSQALLEISESDYESASTVQQIIQRLVPYIASGMNANEIASDVSTNNIQSLALG
jgi:AcrR family transcriptional regulator